MNEVVQILGKKAPLWLWLCAAMWFICLIAYSVVEYITGTNLSYILVKFIMILGAFIFILWGSK